MSVGETAEQRPDNADGSAAQLEYDELESLVGGAVVDRESHCHAEGM